jgi:hypothetical protein
MKTLRLALTLALALAAAPALAKDPGWGLDLSLHAGLDKYDSVGLRSGLDATDFSSSQQLKDASTSIGGTAILRLGMLDVGAIGELGRPGKTNDTTVLGLMGGVNLDVGPLRFEALGELGGHRYGNALHNSTIISESTGSDWLAYVGLRPGLSMKLGEDGRWLLGVWAFARWDVTSKTVQVTLADTTTGSYKLGGSQFGAALRFGFSL